MSIASFFGRWKVLRPMIEPLPPPSRTARDLGEDAVEVLGLAAREDDDAPAVEGRLHDMADARGRGRDVDVALLVDLLRRGELEMRRVGGLTLMIWAPSCAAICAA